jgi:hypothetical protein
MRYESLNRVFTEGFTAMDVAEPLISFDAETSVISARETLSRKDFDVAGVRRDGSIAGYVAREDLEGGCLGDALREVIAVLDLHPQAFVSVLGRVGGIVTRSDMLKPPVRMWLFGMISVLEMSMTRLILNECRDEAWRERLSEGRLRKAEELLEERRRRNQALSLLDCLQFSDKGQIVMKMPELRSRTRFESRKAGEQVIKRLESLRNDLAHNQDILAANWDTIVQLSSNVDTLVRSAERWREPSAG